MQRRRHVLEVRAKIEPHTGSNRLLCKCTQSMHMSALQMAVITASAALLTWHGEQGHCREVQPILNV
jgi:hypothetical protein